MLKIKKKISYKLQDSYAFQGLPISVENKAGSIRRSEPGQTPKWQTKMGYDYGYIRNTEAKDGEALDVYVNRKGERKNYHIVTNKIGDQVFIPKVFVIHQKQIQKTSKWYNGICPDCKKHHTECKHAYDEDKVMLGFNTKDEAIKAYLEQYDSSRFLGPVSTFSLPQFKRVLKNSWGKKLPYKNGKHEHWHGFDLDGTLAKDDGWKGIKHIGDPVEKTRNRIEKLLKEGKKVKIFTARAYDKKAIKPIQDWLKLNNIPLLEITNKKDPGMVSLEDDRAVQVRKNTGNLVKSIYYLDLDKSYLGQAGDPFGSTAMLQENIRKKNPKAIIVAKGCMKKMMTGQQEIEDSKRYEWIRQHNARMLGINLDDEVEEMYQKNKLPNETKEEYTQRSKKETIAKQSQMITGYMQKGVVIPRGDLKKAYVKTHTRHTKTGKIVRVMAHTDVRQKHISSSTKTESKDEEKPKKENEITIYHNSPVKIDKIDKKGKFGEFLFFSSDEDAYAGKHTYSVDISKDDIIDASRLFYHDDAEKLSDIVEDVSETLGVDKEIAESLLEESKTTYDVEEIDPEDAGEDGWYVQKKTAESAKKLGYKGVAVEDEFGTSYMIDMENVKFNKKVEKSLSSKIIIPRDEFKKGFVKQHTRKGKTVAAYYTKRKKKVGDVKHVTMHRLDLTPKEANAKIALLEKAKKVHQDHIDLAKEHKKEAEESKAGGKEYYEKHGRKYLVDPAINHLNDHIKHHTNKKQSHDNHIKKIEGRWETEHEYWDKKRAEKKDKKKLTEKVVTVHREKKPENKKDLDVSSLPELKGVSEKQVSYANDMRDVVLNNDIITILNKTKDKYNQLISNKKEPIFITAQIINH